MRLMVAAVASALLLPPLFCPAQAAADDVDPAGIAKGLLPHRAVYDISLDDASSSSNISGVSGRLVFEVTGSSCEGFTVNSRFVTEVNDQDGAQRVTDLRSSTYENADADSFQFLSRTFTDQRLQEEAKGSARRADDAVVVDLTQPQETKLRFDADVMFPTQHLIHLIASAEADQRVVQADLYDGSDAGATIYTTTAILGAVSDEPVGDDADSTLADAVGTTRHWPVSLSYFDLSKGQVGELTPIYTLRFQLFENGVSRDLRLDYGSFTLSGKLVELDRLPRSTCK
ncbi:hypothetical protein AB7M35_003052 [Amorphus suaedae]